MNMNAFDLNALIEPPKTLEGAIAYLCTVINYDVQGWIISLTPEQAQAELLSKLVFRELIKQPPGQPLSLRCHP